MDLFNNAAIIGMARGIFAVGSRSRVWGGEHLRAAKAGAGAKQRIFRWGAKVAITYSRALEGDGGPSAALKAQRALADRLVYGKIKAAMGGDLVWAVSGGGPLGERLGHFFRGLGLVLVAVGAWAWLAA